MTIPINPGLPSPAREEIAAIMAERDALRHENELARTILAGTDIGSLPNDWTLPRVAEARWHDWHTMRDQVRDTCARAEKAEHDRDTLAERLRVAEAALIQASHNAT